MSTAAKENPLARKLRAGLDLGCRLCLVLACIFLFAIAALVLAQIIGRMFGYLVPSAIDFAAFSMAATTFLGLAPTFRRGQHIRVLLALRLLRPGARRGVEVVNVALGACLFAFVAWKTGEMTWVSYDFGDVSIGMIPVPLWIPQMALCFGSAMAAAVLLDELVRLLDGGTPLFTLNETEQAPEDQSI